MTFNLTPRLPTACTRPPTRCLSLSTNRPGRRLLPGVRSLPITHMDSSGKGRMRNAAVAGKRVFLRAPTARDLNELITLNRSSSHLHRGLVSPPTKPEQFHASLKRCRRVDCVWFLICRVVLDDFRGLLPIPQGVRLVGAPRGEQPGRRLVRPGATYGPLYTCSEGLCAPTARS